MSDLKPAPDGYPIKLVRDHTAALINSSGEPGDLFYAPLPADERAGWLRKKLLEEAVEYLESRSTKELGDVLAVVEALCDLHGTTVHALYVRAVHLHPRGGFGDGVMMYGRHDEFDAADPDDKLGRR